MRNSMLREVLQKPAPLKKKPRKVPGLQINKIVHTREKVSAKHNTMARTLRGIRK